MVYMLSRSTLQCGPALLLLLLLGIENSEVAPNPYIAKTPQMCIHVIEYKILHVRVRLSNLIHPPELCEEVGAYDHRAALQGAVPMRQ